MSEDGLVKLIIGAVLNLIPIVNLLSAGYLIELMSNSIQGREEMPAWEDWGGKFIKGLLVAVITFIYMFIPFVIMMMGGGMALFYRSGFSLLAIIGMLLGLVAWFIIPMALAHFAASGSFGSAFDFGSIISRITGSLGSYLAAYLLSIAMIFVLMIISMIPILGWIIGLLGGFYIGCVMFFIFGEVYRAGGTDAV